MGLTAAGDLGELVDGHVEHEVAVGFGVGLDGALQWDRIRPLIHRAFGNTKGFGGRGLRTTKVGNNVVFSHGLQKYSMLNTQVKDAGPVGLYAGLMETMGDRIRQLRKARGLTQEAFAELVGVTKSAVSQWEDGSTKNLKLATFLRACEV